MAKVICKENLASRLLRVIRIPRGDFPKLVVEDEFEVYKTSRAMDEEVNSIDMLVGKSYKRS